MTNNQCGKISLLINTQKGYDVLTSLYNSYEKYISLVISYDDPQTKDDSFSKIKEFCSKNNITFFNEKKPQMIESILKDHNSDFSLVIGWQYLLPNDLIEKITTIIFHDSLLPKYRGFAPLVTTLINGETEIGVTALKASQDVDSGPVFKQAKKTINYPQKIENALELMSSLYQNLSLELLEAYLSEKLEFKEQDHSKATYSIWRDEQDYHLNFNQDSQRVLRTIHALRPPYKGAYTFIDGEKITILDAQAVSDLIYEIRDVGKVCSLENGDPIVICKEGLIKLTDLRRENGEKYTLKKLRQRLT